MEQGKPIDRSIIGLAQKRFSQYELPPNELSGFIAPFLRRSTTLQSWADAPKQDDPVSARFTKEPDEIFAPSEQQSLRLIDELENKRKAEQSVSRVSTGLSLGNLSRTSSIDPIDGIAKEFVGLRVGDIYDGYTYDSKSERGPDSDIISLAPTPTRQPSTRPGHGRPRSNTAASQGNIRPVRQNSIATTSVQAPPDRVIGSRVTKKSKDTPDKGKEPMLSSPLGCPMCKANRRRYIAVAGPCTDLKGISPTMKSLNEHLKKQHSRENRCMKCLKWHKCMADLVAHEAPNEKRCWTCCREFKNPYELGKHEKAEGDCTPDHSTRPELFTKEQEKAFKEMRNKAGGKGKAEPDTRGKLESKYRWIFAELFPKHQHKDTINPYYDFAIIAHHIPESVASLETLIPYAGGLRRELSPETFEASPPERMTVEDSPMSNDAEGSPDDFVIGGFDSSGQFVPSAVQPQEESRPPQTYIPTSFTSFAAVFQSAEPMTPDPRTFLQHNRFLSSSTTSAVPTLRTDIQSSVGPPPQPATPDIAFGSHRTTQDSPISPLASMSMAAPYPLMPSVTDAHGFNVSMPNMHNTLLAQNETAWTDPFSSSPQQVMNAPEGQIAVSQPMQRELTFDTNGFQDFVDGPSPAEETLMMQDSPYFQKHGPVSTLPQESFHPIASTAFQHQHYVADHGQLQHDYSNTGSQPMYQQTQTNNGNPGLYYSQNTQQSGNPGSIDHQWSQGS